LCERETDSPAHKENIMRALHTTLALESGGGWTPTAIVNPRRSAPKTVERATTAWDVLKNMALFLSAPFVGLLYAILLPFVGLAMLAWFAGRALFESGKLHEAARVGKKALLFAAAPVIGLVFLVAMPFAGLGMLAWSAATAIMGAPVK
jgi:hypothetical protein